MGFEHQVQRCRYELKYVIDEVTAARVRDFARCHLQRDEHAVPEMRYSYPIYSVYVDGPGLCLYQATCQGQLNRYKLRVRYYNENPWSPVFFEIKRRVHEAILKERAVVRRECMAELLRGRCPRLEDLVNPEDAESYKCLRRFCELQANIGGAGKCIVYYQREAWVTPTDDNVRLTFDRELATARYDGTLTDKRWFKVPMEGVVLEMKFDSRFPVWMNELTRSFDLYKTTFAKYVFCTEALPKVDPLPGLGGRLPSVSAEGRISHGGPARRRIPGVEGLGPLVSPLTRGDHRLG